ADAIKLQTYTADTMTLPSQDERFQVGEGSLWEGKSLYELYQEAYTPWEWQPKLQETARTKRIDFFSAPFDTTAVDFLEEMEIPAYKVPSFEIVDLPLIERIASTGKPLIFSTGLASQNEIAEALQTAEKAGAEQVALLKCTSAYPAPPEEMNLRGIPQLIEEYGVPVGLSDHSLGSEAPIAAVSLGACIVEKHFTLSREVPGPDAAFSMEPEEFHAMVSSVRRTERALGDGDYEIGPEEAKSRVFRRSLFVVQDVKAGEMFTTANVRSIRPGDGLHPRHLKELLGRKAAVDVVRGTPMAWDLVV
ncbi:MAG: pseudaminic acid synthase, partial [Thermoplasmata archaeon]